MLDPSHIISELKGRLTDQYLQKWNEELCNVSKIKVIRVNWSWKVICCYLCICGQHS